MSNENITWGNIRIYIKRGWGLSWQLLTPYSNETSSYRLVRFTRQQFPNSGSCVFQFDYGRFNGIDHNAVPLDLINSFVRIDGSADGESYETVWMGTVVSERDTVWPGADYRAGSREYHCEDLISILRYRHLFTHAYYYEGTNIDSVEGHPGWNDAGRFDNSGVRVDNKYFAHSVAGLGEGFKMRDIVEECLALSLSPNDPPLFLAPYAESGGSPLDEVRSVPYTDGQSVYDIIAGILTARRGIYAYLDWDNEGENPRITVSPYLIADYDLPTDTGTVSVSGGETLGTVVDLSFEGDKRLGADGPLRYEETIVDWSQALGVAVYGERMEVTCNLTGLDLTLSPRYSAAEATALSNSDDEVSEVRYGHVFRSFGIPYDWATALVGDGAGAGKTRIDYRFSGVDAAIAIGTGAPVVSGASVDIVDSTCMYDGINYAVNPPAPYEAGDPIRERERVPIQAYRVEDGVYTSLYDDEDLRVTISRDGPDLRVTSSEDDGPIRMLSEDGEDGIAVVAALRLPIRPVAFGSRTGGGTGIQVRNIFVADAHLWLVNTGTILGVNAGDIVRPVATTGIPAAALARDDRMRLRQVLEQSRQYYLRERRKGAWSLRCFGFGVDTDTIATEWPRLGNIIREVTRAGETVEWGTPVSRVEYDHIEGLTTWTTDMDEKDWA